MKNLTDIIRRRAIPGTLVFDSSGTLQFMNEQADVLLLGFKDYLAAGDEHPSYLLAEIRDVCEELKESPDYNDNGPGMYNPTRLMVSERGAVYSLRAFFVGHLGEECRSSHIVVLIEKIIDRHEVDLDSAKHEFSLSRRETDVLKLVCSGFANREISEQMFISEYTVKDHIKNIMKKMNVKSRNGIVACLR